MFLRWDGGKVSRENAPVNLGRSIPEFCQAEFGHPVANQLQGEAVFGFFVDKQIDEGEPLWLVGRFGQQSAIALVIKLCVRLIHDRLGTDHPQVIVPQRPPARKADEVVR
jgi:hypothetical protein